MRAHLLSLFLAAGPTPVAAPAPAPAAPVAPAPKPVPSDAQCIALPALKSPWAFGPGEVLEFDLDAMGAKAGTMTMKALPAKDGVMPVEVHAQTNTFFAKIRRVNGLATSYMSQKTLRPVRYTEDALENEVKKTADVTFRAKDHHVGVAFNVGGQTGSSEFRYANEGLDVAGAIYVIRQLPLKEGLPVCFDVYGIRKLWRVYGVVGKREHVSLPIGEFEAWHLAGDAVRLDDNRWRREIHVWISDDEKRLPIAALGAIDIGAIRATLTAFSRPGDKRKAEGKESLKW